MQLLNLRQWFFIPDFVFLHQIDSRSYPSSFPRACWRRLIRGRTYCLQTVFYIRDLHFVDSPYRHWREACILFEGFRCRLGSFYHYQVQLRTDLCHDLMSWYFGCWIAGCRRPWMLLD